MNPTIENLRGERGEGLRRYLEGKTANDFNGRMTIEVWGEYCMFVADEGYAPMRRMRFVDLMTTIGLNTRGSRRYGKTYFVSIIKEM